MRLPAHDYTMALACIGLVLCLFSVLFFQRDHLVDSVVEQISPEDEREIGEALFQLVEKDVVQDAKLRTLFQELVQDLLEHIDKDTYQYDIHLVHNPDVNAAAMPGGFIIVNTGLVMAAETPEEVLGVVAHEMAHVRQRHVLKGLVNAVGVSVLFGVVPEAEGIIGMVTENGDTLFERHYSRELEQEADAVGVEFLRQAKLSPLGLKRFFSRLQEKGDDAEYLGILSTHPTMASRIEHLDALIAGEQSGYRTPAVNFKALKTAINALEVQEN